MTPVPVADPVLTARIYQETRERISELATGLDDAALNTAVAACPGWWVRGVVAHVAAVADDWAEGRLSGPPTDEETAAQIARFDGHDMTEILAACAAAAASSSQPWTGLGTRLRYSNTCTYSARPQQPTSSNSVRHLSN